MSVTISAPIRLKREYPDAVRVITGDKEDRVILLVIPPHGVGQSIELSLEAAAALRAALPMRKGKPA